MRKMKQVAALVLSVILMVCCAGCEKTTYKAKTISPDVAYAQVVQRAVNQYGIVDEDKAEFSYDWERHPFTGVMAAERLDLTGDGEDELFLMYFDGDIQMEVYEFANNQAVKKWSDTKLWGGIFNLNVYDTPNGLYWSWNSSRYWPADMITYKNGEYISAMKMGDFTEEEISRYRDGESFAGLMQEGDAFSKIFADRLGLDISNIEYGSENHIYNYHAEGPLPAVNEAEFLTGWDVKIPEPRLSPLQALGDIKYYGDPAICKMTKEMAQAYANAIEEDKKLIGSEDYGRSDVLRAALVDVAEDGIPLLITTFTQNGNELAYFDDEENFFIWTWDGTKAEKYDFRKDIETRYIFGYMFYPGDSEAMIRVSDGVALDVGGASGEIDYMVSNAQIKKVKHVMRYSAFPHQGGARGELLPGVNAQKAGDGGYGYTAEISDLLDAGWVGHINDDGEYDAFYIMSENGELLSYGTYDELQAYWSWKNLDDNEWQEKEKYEIMFASTGQSGIAEEVGTADDAIDALLSYSDAVGRPYYSSYADVLNILTEEQVKALAEEAAKRFDGTVGEIYKLSDDLYYVTIYVDGEFAGGTVVKNVSNGTGWTVVESDEEVLSEENLAQLVAKDNSVSNIVIDYKETENAEKYIDEVFGSIDGTTPNDAAKEELADYAQKFITENSKSTLKAKDNCIVIDAKAIGDAAKSAADAKSEIDSVLEKHTVELNKKVTVILRIVCRNMNSASPMQITIDGSCLESIGDADAVYIELCEGYGVKLSKENLSMLVDNFGKITVTITADEDGSHNIQFAEENGNVIHQLPVSMTFTLPAGNELCTVYAEYQGGTDNWGGQFDEIKKELSFETPYTGKYTVREETADIADIAELSEEHQKAIRFMVSKGFFSLSEGKFNPNATLTRYSFSESLVRMFFMLDRSLATSFTDVPGESPYYPYVASGENANIIEGYDDNTFRGENDVLREEVIALCSRTLRERKGYAEPENPSDFLHFADNGKIPEWAESEIALAVRETLIQDGGILSPDTAITRADSALLLYRLFMLLYEVEPVAVKDVSGVSGLGLIGGGAAVAGLAGFGAIAAIVIRRRKKHKK